MKVIVPFTKISKTQITVFQIEGIQPEYVPMTHYDSYWKLLKRQWEAREPFILVEHDILPWPTALAQLEACYDPWCALPYMIGGRFSWAFGCIKFGQGIFDKLPTILDELPYRNWFNLDSEITWRAETNHQVRLHRHHASPLIHLNQEHAGFAVRETENPNSYRARKRRAEASRQGTS